MLLNNTRPDIQMSGMVVQKAMTIKASPEMFDLLAKQLYPDPIKAVVREIAFGNTIDASEEGGIVDIWLPNQLKAEFVVRDHGCGMSHQFVLDNYSTFGDSFKNKSNEYIGAMGVGSKSGFAYQDSFTITSYHDGTKSTYVVTRGQDGIPQVNLVGQWPTDESGLEYKIAVNNKDIDKFRVWTQCFLSWYKVQPYKNIQFKTYGGYPPNYDPLDLKELDPGKLYYGTTSSKVIMGGIVYDHPRIKSGLYDSGLVYLADIGEFAVTASRDEIRSSEYDDTFKEYVYKKEDESLQDLIDKVSVAPTTKDQFEIIEGLPHKVTSRILANSPLKGVITTNLPAGCHAEWYLRNNYYKQLDLKQTGLHVETWNGKKRATRSYYSTYINVDTPIYYIDKGKTKIPSTLKYNESGPCRLTECAKTAAFFKDNGFEVTLFSTLDKPPSNRAVTTSTTKKTAGAPVLGKYTRIKDGGYMYYELDREEILKRKNVYKVYTSDSQPDFPHLDLLKDYLVEHSDTEEYNLVYVNQVQKGWYDKHINNNVQQLYDKCVAQAQKFLNDNPWGKFDLYWHSKKVNSYTLGVYKLLNSIQSFSTPKTNRAHSLVLSNDRSWDYKDPTDLQKYETFDRKVKSHKYYHLINFSGTDEEHKNLMEDLDMI